jgi:hypothetical protein
MQASYKAWVRHDGTHETKAQDFRRWNDELLRQMNEDLEDRWAEFTKFLDKAANGVPHFMQMELSNLSLKMCGEFAFFPLLSLKSTDKSPDLQVSQSLITCVKLKERELRYLLHEELSKMAQDIR